MHAPTTRVVHENMPYLVVMEDDGTVRGAYGPFTLGAEPNLADCTADTEVRDPDLLRALVTLVPVSPTLPPVRDTLADG